MASQSIYSYRFVNQHPWQPQGYIAPSIDMAESEGELGRALRLQEQVVRFKGGLLPDIVRLGRVKSVLDVGCGVGVWTQAMALRYPSIRFTGIDINTIALTVAQLRLPQGTQNVRYLAQDMYTLDVRPFGREAFDLVHLRWLAGDVPAEQFGRLIHTLVQQCRVEGKIVWTEAELPITSSSACDFVSAMILAALEATGHTFSPGVSLSLGLARCMTCWLYDARCTLIRDEDDMIPIDTGTEVHAVFVQEIELLARRVQPFVLATGIVTEEFYNEQLTRLGQEIRERSFQGVCRLRTITATRKRI